MRARCLPPQLHAVDGKLQARKATLSRSSEHTPSKSPPPDSKAWDARVAAVEAAEPRRSSKLSDDSGQSPTWNRDTSPSILTNALDAALNSPKFDPVKFESSASKSAKKPAPFRAGGSLSVPPSATGGSEPLPHLSQLSTAERVAKREAREKRRREKEAATTKKLRAARRLAKQKQKEQHRRKEEMRLANKRGSL